MVNTPYVQGCRDVSWTKKDSFSQTITPEGCPFTLHPETLLFNVSSSLAPPLCVFFSQETSGLRLLEFSKWNRGRFHRGVVMFLRAKPSWIWKLFCLFFAMFYGFYYGKSPCFTIIWYEYFWIFFQPPYASKSKVKFLWKSLPPKNSSSAGWANQESYLTNKWINEAYGDDKGALRRTPQDAEVMKVKSRKKSTGSCAEYGVKTRI